MHTAFSRLYMLKYSQWTDDTWHFWSTWRTCAADVQSR